MAFGLDVPPSGPLLTERRVLLLRCLGRLEFALTSQIRALVYPDHSHFAVHDALHALMTEDLIWRIPTRFALTPPRRSGGKAPPLKPPYVYGLTHHGQALLDTIDAEADPHALAALRFRDPRGRPVSQITLAHDLLVSWWCSSVLVACRQQPLIQRVVVQCEYTVAQQRMDALIIIRLATTPRATTQAWEIPFADGTPCRPDETEIRLALEIDRGTEPLPVLLRKAATYRDHTVTGAYNRALGGPVLPVVLVPTARRAGQIAREWQRMWQDGWGLISTPRQADHATYGTLWGQYLSMRDGTPGQVLTALVQDATSRTVTLRPATTLAAWAATWNAPAAQPP